jgi:hypothetical protein
MADPTVKEVHEARARLAKECGFDMHRLFLMQVADYAEWLRQHPRAAPHANATRAASELRETDADYPARTERPT